MQGDLIWSANLYVWFIQKGVGSWAARKLIVDERPKPNQKLYKKIKINNIILGFFQLSCGHRLLGLLSLKSACGFQNKEHSKIFEVQQHGFLSPSLNRE